MMDEKKGGVCYYSKSTDKKTAHADADQNKQKQAMGDKNADHMKEVKNAPKK